MNSVRIRLLLAQIGYWGLYGVFAAYAVALALSKGFSQSSSSRYVSIFLICGFFGQFLWSSLSDKLRTNKWMFVASIAVTAAAQAGMYLASSEHGFLLFYALFGLAVNPAGSLLDTWTLRLNGFDMKIYGRIRSWGSLGYAGTTLVLGIGIDRFGYRVLIIAGTALVLFIIASVCTLPDPSAGGKKEKIRYKDLFVVFRDKKYLLLLLIVFLVGMSYVPINKLKIMVYRSVGGSTTHQGLDGFVGNFVQFFIYRFIGSFERISVNRHLLLTAGMMLTAVLMSIAAHTPWLIIASSVFVFAVFCFCTSISRRVVKERVAEEYQTTAIGVADACFNTISGALALTYAGSVAQHYSVRIMLCALGAPSLAAVLILSCVFLKGRRKTA